MDKETLLWLVLFIVFLVVESITVTLTSIWYAIGAFVAMILSLFEVPLVVQILVAVTVATILVVFTKPVLSKYLLSKRTKTNYESVIGEKAKVTEQINNIENKGTVMINGLEWTARTQDNKVIEIGEIVEIVKVEGVKVIVK